MQMPGAMEAAQSARVDPFLMAVLKNRFEAIVREMALVVLKSSRSAVIKNGHDFSCAILTHDCKLISTEKALPIHVLSMELAIRPIIDLFDDIKPGDMFLNNCPYTGGTHHADMILAAPIFVEGSPLFWAVSLSHHADIGAPSPTTYLPYAKTVYEEGLHFPCVRVLENDTEKADIFRICMMKIRAPQVWLGDFRAQIGACRTAQNRLIELVGRYSKATVIEFIDGWFEYGRRQMIAEIAKLPKGEFTYETRHDPVLGVAEDGIPVKVTVRVDPDEGWITLDIRDNVDNVVGGLNTSENTTTGACRLGVFNNLDPNLPHNYGAISRIRVELAEGKVVGRPRFPTGTSVATTNVLDRLISAVNCAFSVMGENFGQGEGGPHLPMGIGVISGCDPFKNAQTYVSEIFIGYAGNGARRGFDGWLTYCGPSNGGMIMLGSVEVDESIYPIIVESRGVDPDTQGFGEFEGSPGVTGVFYPVANPMSVAYAADGTLSPPRGVRGGGDALPGFSRKALATGEIVELPAFAEVVCEVGEKLIFRACGGGGFGDPANRQIARIVDTVNRGWLSAARAEEAYSVRLRYDVGTAQYWAE